MTTKKKKQKKSKGLNWRWGLIIPIIGVLIGISLIKPWTFPKQPTTHVYTDSISVQESLPVELEKQDEVSKKPIEIEEIESPSPETPWAALIIDDFGPAGTARMVKSFLELPFDVTFSILPGNSKSISIDETVHELGGESMIHQPMEPIEKESIDESEMLYVSVKPLELKTLLDRVTADLKYAVGMNNHMGSLATSNDTLMSMLAKELKKRGLFFIDSRTVHHSRAKPVMDATGVSALGRDIFIDNIADSTEIVRQLNKMINKAKRRGWVIGIAHARSSTLAVLKDVAPIVKNSGVKFVTASKLVETIMDKKNAEIATIN